jgi:hypothetical protein
MANQQHQTSVDKGSATRKRYTSAGKELRILPVGKGTSFYKLAFYPGGQAPKEWANHQYTSITEAQKAIDSYLRVKR